MSSEAPVAPLREATVLCECEAFRLVDSKLKPLSHTSGLVEKQKAQLVRLAGADRVLAIRLKPATGEVDEYVMHDDWTLSPDQVGKVARDVHTERPAGESLAETLANGAFEGEDIPLYCFEIKRKNHLLQRIFKPNTQVEVPPHGPPHMSKLRLGFESEAEARDWYSLVALSLGHMSGDNPALADLPLARANSAKILAA